MIVFSPPSSLFAALRLLDLNICILHILCTQAHMHMLHCLFTVRFLIRMSTVTRDYRSILRHSMLPSLWCTLENGNFSHVVQLNTAVTNHMLELAAVALGMNLWHMYIPCDSTAASAVSSILYIHLVLSLYRCDGNTLYLRWNSIHIGAKLCTDQVLSSQEMSSQRGVDKQPQGTMPSRWPPTYLCAIPVCMHPDCIATIMFVQALQALYGHHVLQQAAFLPADCGWISAATGPNWNDKWFWIAPPSAWVLDLSKVYQQMPFRSCKACASAENSCLSDRHFLKVRTLPLGKKASCVCAAVHLWCWCGCIAC